MLISNLILKNAQKITRSVMIYFLMIRFFMFLVDKLNTAGEHPFIFAGKAGQLEGLLMVPQPFINPISLC